MDRRNQDIPILKLALAAISIITDSFRCFVSKTKVENMMRAKYFAPRIEKYPYKTSSLDSGTKNIRNFEINTSCTVT